MKIINIDQNSTEWEDIRKGKITGSKLKDILTLRGTGKKLGFYELMAERLAIEENEEDPMERGHRLEDEVIKKFEEETGKQVDKVGFITREDDDRIACSPDGLIKVGKKYKEAVECKCLSASRHLQAYFEKKIPSEYDFQVLQYFIVNEDLETLYFCFYDPRITVKPFFKLEVHRKDIKDDIEMYHKEQIKLLGEIDKLLAELTF